MTHESLPTALPIEVNQLPDIGAEFGLPNGQFAVERNIYDDPAAEKPKVIDTYIEHGGWSVVGKSEVTSKDGTTLVYLQIENMSDGITKKIPLDKLISIQQKVEDIDKTVPRAELLAMRKKQIGTVATKEEEPEILGESLRVGTLTERQQMIFEPFIASKDSLEFDYDSLFNPEADFSHLTVEGAAVKSEGREPSDESLQRAETILEAPALDNKIKQIINRNANGVKNSEDVVKLVRENPSMRYELASYFLTKIAQLPDMPRRVAANGMKSSGFKGYEGKPQTTSQEYASLLALSMLDGTFKPESVADGIVKDENGEVELGQHRYAAEAILLF